MESELFEVSNKDAILTVRELIEILQGYAPDTPVWMHAGTGSGDVPLRDHALFARYEGREAKSICMLVGRGK